MTEIAREALLGDPGTVNIEAYRRDQTSSLSDLRVQGTTLRDTDTISKLLEQEPWWPAR
jgi:hypothetical protein